MGGTGPGRAAALLGALALAGCAGPTARPTVEIKPVEVKVPVATPCVRTGDLPARPAPIAPRLNGDAVHDLDLVAAQALRLAAWGDQLAAALKACAGGD